MEHTNVHGFIFAGGLLWLDFVNTQVVKQGQTVDRLESVDDWLAWVRDAGILTSREVAQLKANFPGAAGQTRALVEIREFRAVLRQVAGAMANGSRLAPKLLAAINALLAVPFGYPQLVRAGGEYRRQTRCKLTGLDHLLAPVAQSVSATLCGEDSGQIRQCANPACILFYLDSSKNQSRRWCRMAACGNRDKARAFQRRRRAAISG